MDSFHVKSENKGIKFKSDHQRGLWLTRLSQLDGKEFVLSIDERKPKRSDAQNNALHLWFELLARELNNAGYTVQIVLSHKMDIDWNKELIKDLLWKPAQQAILKKKSTTELRKVEDIDKVWEHLNRHIGEKFGVHVPFPNNEQKEFAELL